MSAVVFGEVDDSGTRILVTCTGDDIDLNQCAAVLLSLTPAFNPTDDPMVRAVPLTWTAATQLAHNFAADELRWVPGPRLCEWLMAEIIRRSCQGEVTGVPPLLAPMNHQSAAAVAIGMNGRFLLADDMGTGKGGSYLMGLAELDARNRNPWPAVLVCPAGVVDTLLEEIPQWYPEWKAVAYRGAGRAKYLKSNARILVMGYETMRNDTGDSSKPGPLLKYKPGTVVFDECVPFLTLIDTPTGSRPICSLRPGDYVRGVDHATGRSGWTRVKRVARSPLRKLFQFGRLKLTADHPLWVSDSGCLAYAAGHDQDFYLHPLWRGLRPEVVPQLAGAQVLREGVRAGMAGRGRGDEAAGPGEPAGSEDVPEVAGVPGVGPEPVPGLVGRSDPEARARHERGEWLAGPDWRERGAYYPAGAVAEAARRRVHPRVLCKPGPAGTWVPDLLQSGPWLPEAEARHRAGRYEPPGSTGTGTRPQEGYETGLTWLDGAEVSEYGSPERSLWNIETGSGNYVAAGRLVHNCHALCNYGSLQSREARKLARHAPNVIAGSGTPITRNVAGFWPVLNSMYPKSYPDRGRYKGHYCIGRRSQYGSGMNDSDITGLDPLRAAEFRTDMQGVFRRVSKEDVLDLPGKTYARRYVEIPPAWRAAYDQMEADMLAELPDSLTPLEANVAIVKMMRLRQLACSACDVAVTRETEGDPRSPKYGTEAEHTTVTLKEPCWKGAALVDILGELHESEGEFDELGRQHGHTVGSRPVIAFAESSQLIRVAGTMAQKKGYETGFIDGSVSHAGRKEVRLAFQANKLDLICVTTGTGGTGLNLTAADTVVFLARPWGYVPAVQAEDRAYRRGQGKPVQVIDIIAKNTVESRVLAKLREKAGALAELVQDRRIAEAFLGGRT